MGMLYIGGLAVLAAVAAATTVWFGWGLLRNIVVVMSRVRNDVPEPDEEESGDAAEEEPKEELSI